MALIKASTRYGVVSGVRCENSKNTIFKGIPYAKPPVGKLRFAPPQSPDPWEGVRVCDTWSSACIQQNRRHSPESEKLNTSEDCLYLNIWTPAESPDEKLPVMFWIHGGGFCNGAGFQKEFDGEAMNRRGVILVTVNYRCGVLGFLALPQLTAASPMHASGNYGIQDEIMALKWVRENISAFGGDAGNITAFGQSAGGISTRMLLVSPLCRGLFQHAIVQSGGGLNEADAVRPLEEMSEICDKARLSLGFSLDDLMQKDAEEVHARMSEAVDTILEKKELFFFQPCIDGYSLFDVPGKSIHDGRFADMDIMCGTVSGDSMMFTRKVRDNLTDNPAAQRAFAYTPGISWARHQIRTGRKPIYTYFFERNLPGDSRGAPHASELGYMFGTLSRLDRPWEPLDYALSEAMLDYWTNFAKHGSPNGGNQPAWTPFTEEAPFTMDISDNGLAVKDLTDNAEAEKVVAFIEAHPGFLVSLKDF